MFNRHSLVVYVCTALLLNSCNRTNSRPLKEILKEVNKSTVLVYYQDKPGHGTGFFVEGNQEGCNVLTARHVVPLKTQIKLKTSDQKNWVINDIQRFPNHDLAVINFKPDNSNKCPYKTLSIGDSDVLNILDDIYITGFPGNGFVAQFTSGKISFIGDSNTDGYGISYTATTAGGMSGGPVINTLGEVIAVHGRTDVELSRIAELEGEELPSQEQSTEGNDFKLGDSVGTFKWGIPIKAYLENIAQVDKISQEVLEAKDFFNQGNDLYAYNDYEKALEFYNKSVTIKPDYYQAWSNRGDTLNRLKRYKEAIESYDKAIAIKPDDAYAWHNRSFSLKNLKRYKEAIESFDKAIDIKPDFHQAWNNRGNSLRNLKRYKEAIESFDKAIDIKPDFAFAWANRGILLRNLKRYKESIESFDKVIAIKPDFVANAWYDRGYALEQLKRYKEAIESYDKAIKLNPNYETAINNRKRLLNQIE